MSRTGGTVGQIDGRMGAEYKEPQHAPGCPCPRCSGKERPPMGEDDKWRAAAEAATPYCAACGAVLDEETRGLPCADCAAKGSRGGVEQMAGAPGIRGAEAPALSLDHQPPADQGAELATGLQAQQSPTAPAQHRAAGPHAASVIAYRSTDEEGTTTAVASVIGREVTHVILETPGWVEARSEADPRFFSACKYPRAVVDALPFARVPLAAVGCPECRAFVARRGLDLGSPPANDAVERAVAAYLAAGGGLEGRKQAARVLHKAGAYSARTWIGLRERFKAVS